MGQTRLNWYMLLRKYNDETDALDIKQIANKFVARNSSLYRIILEILRTYHFCACILCHIVLWNTNLCSLLNTKLKHPQTKKVAYGHGMHLLPLRRDLAAS